MKRSHRVSGTSVKCFTAFSQFSKHGYLPSRFTMNTYHYWASLTKITKKKTIGQFTIISTLINFFIGCTLHTLACKNVTCVTQLSFIHQHIRGKLMLPLPHCKLMQPFWLHHKNFNSITLYYDGISTFHLDIMIFQPRKTHPRIKRWLFWTFSLSSEQPLNKN